MVRSLTIFALTIVCASAVLAQVGFLTRISTSQDGSQGNGYSNVFSTEGLSDYGRYAVSYSSATNLISGDTNNRGDIFRKDTWTGEVVIASVSSSGVQANASSSEEDVAISSDGRYVVFSSSASNLVDNDTNGQFGQDVFRRDCLLGITERASVNWIGSQLSRSWAGSISGDGRFVVFMSSDPGVVPGVSGTARRAYVRDMLTGTTELVSVSSTGQVANSDSYCYSISDDGNKLAFFSLATNLTEEQIYPDNNSYVRDRAAGITEFVAKTAAGTPANGPSSWPVVSGDGSFVAFSSPANNLVVGDTNSSEDIFLKSLVDHTIRRVSVRSDGQQGNRGGIVPSIDRFGRFIAFRSWSSNLAVADTNNRADAFVHDVLTGKTTLETVSTTGAQSNFHLDFGPVLSPDGAFLMFPSGYSGYVSGDTNGAYDVFLRDRRSVLYPLEFSIVEGELFSGDLASLQQTDGNLLSTLNDATTLAMTVEFAATCTLFSPSKIRTTLMSAAGRSGLAINVQLFRYSDAQWQAVGGGLAPTELSSLSFSTVGDAALHVQGGTGNLRCRLSWSPINDEDPSQDGWIISLDQVTWTITP